MGPSGIGKTTLLRLMGDKFCLIVVIFGLMVTIFLSYHALLYISQEKNEYAFSIRRPFTDMNVFENVAFPLREHTNLPEALIHTTVMMKLEAVGLRGAANLMPSELSGEWRAEPL